MTAAELLRTTRLRAGLSQQQLADRLEVKQPSVARLEMDDADPRVSTLVRALNAAGYALILHAVPQDPQVDEGQIRELRRLSPAHRLERFEENHSTMTDFLRGVRRVDG